MHRAIVAALALGFDTVQVFVKNQRQWRAAPLKPEDIARWHELLATPGFGPPVAHATYLINVATADAGLGVRSRKALAEELQRCGTLCIPYLVIHPGAAGDTPTEAAIARAAQAINEVYGRRPELQTMLVLETTAGQGSSLGRSLEELAEIIRQVEEPQRVGVCIDTCHVFAAGYDIRTPDAYHAMMELVGRTIGLDRVRCWHLNDSRGRLGSRLDRHEHIGRGRITSAGFRQVLSDPRFCGVPMILETPKGTDPRGRDWDALNLRRLRSIARACRPSR